MHDIIQNGLEEFLDGRVRRDFQAHLDECAGCRAEVREFQEMSGMFTAFRETAPVEPAPGFYFRVSQIIEAEKEAEKKQSFWNVFSLDAVFGRRVAFASLMTLALVGGLLVSQEAGEVNAPDKSAETIIASHDFLTPHDSFEDRDRIMSTLVSYEQ